MPQNQIQFQHGMSLSELINTFGTEAKCEAALERTRWPEGFRRPHCGQAAHYVLRVGVRKAFQCGACRRQTSLIAGTLFEGTKLVLTVWFLAIYLISQAKAGLSTLARKRYLGVSYPTAWLLHHKLMQATVEREAHHILSGRVEVDDVYRIGTTRVSEANHELSRWLDEPGGLARRTKRGRSWLLPCIER